MINWLLTLNDAERIYGQLCYDVSMYEGESRKSMECIILDLKPLIDRERERHCGLIEAARKRGERRY